MANLSKLAHRRRTAASALVVLSIVMRRRRREAKSAHLDEGVDLESPKTGSFPSTYARNPNAGYIILSELHANGCLDFRGALEFDSTNNHISRHGNETGYLSRGETGSDPEIPSHRFVYFCCIFVM